MAYQIKLLKNREQSPTDITFVGGFPNMPSRIEWPICGLCERPQTFFFQIAFPDKHPWYGKVMMVFQCTKCDEADFQLPMRPPGLLRGSPILSEFLKSYQKNFRIIVFERIEPMILNPDHEQNLLFQPIELVYKKGNFGSESKVGGNPYWLQNPCAPSSQDGSELEFLMQLNEGFKFEKLEGAPYQWRFSILTQKGGYFRKPYYELFLGLPVLFFGVVNTHDVLVINERP